MIPVSRDGSAQSNFKLRAHSLHRIYGNRTVMTLHYTLT